MPRILSRRWPATARSLPEARRATIDAPYPSRRSQRQLLAAIALAVSEAVGNAVRHAYPAASGDVKLTVEHDLGEIIITVTDTGVGINRTRDPGLGLGVQLMDALTKSCTIDSHSAGTTITLAFDSDPPARPSPEHIPDIHGP
jgi:anti-sigma regulatory factor (Ser/Thr protein kinase)